MNGYSQTVQKLSGSGTISLGAAALMASNTANSIFSGAITGASSLSKTGVSALTLSGANAYSSGATISQGRLIATGSASLGTGAVTNDSILELALATNGTIANRLSGAGIVEKTGTTTVTLTNAASSVGTMDVKAGTLALTQNGTFTAGSYTTETGATTAIGSSSRLAVTGAFTQVADSTLTVAAGSNNNPAITANNATIGRALSVSGVNTTQSLTASGLATNQFTVLSTVTGIAGDFSSVSFGAAAGSTDYLTLAGWKSADTLNYSVGMGLTWLANSQKGNGIFTLSSTTDSFNVDVVLANQNGPFTTSWNGTDLTKNGDGVLTLSAINTYTGIITVNGGTTISQEILVADSSSAFEGHEAIIDPLTGEASQGAAWARVYTNRHTSFAGGEKIWTTTDVTAFQTGLDLFGWSDEMYGSIRAGITFGAGTAKSDTDALWDRSYTARTYARPGLLFWPH